MGVRTKGGEEGQKRQRESGTHHQQLEITPTLNKKGSDAPTRKFS